MSQRDVETLRKISEQGPGGFAAFYDALDPAVEWDTTRQVPDG
jgi:hypothetical protein